LSHSDCGRDIFTDQVISRLSQQKEWVIFLLRGKHAQSKQSLIDRCRHHILTAPHPSPLSAYRGRFGSKHFSQTNSLLQSMGKNPIDWCI
jgi:uracil-DNA glycosylase